MRLSPQYCKPKSSLGFHLSDLSSLTQTRKPHYSDHSICISTQNFLPLTSVQSTSTMVFLSPSSWSTSSVGKYLISCICSSSLSGRRAFLKFSTTKIRLYVRKCRIYLLFVQFAQRFI